MASPAPIRSMPSINGPGAGNAATRAAWRMRLTNVALLPLAVAFIWIVLSLAGKDEAGIRAQFAHPCTAIFMLLFILTGILHMKLGMRSIIDDYVHAARLKEYALMANVMFSVGLCVAAIFAVLKLSLA